MNRLGTILIIILALLCNGTTLFGKKGRIPTGFTIVAGTEATTNGKVLIAHNENGSTQTSAVYLNKLASGKRSNQIFQIETSNKPYGDTYVNGYGVLVVSNRVTSREKKGEISRGGISENLEKIVAARATTAAEGVKLAGSLLNNFGFKASGRIFIIADQNEGWILQAVRGKIWVAKRVPDDHVAVVSNCYTVHNIKPSEGEKIITSRNVIRYAAAKGWWGSKTGEFSFTKAYTAPKALKSRSNILRQWRAINLLSKEKYKIDETFPFSFQPRRKIKTSDLFKVLRDHFEETEYDLSDSYKKGSPHNTQNSPICSGDTQYSFVARLQNRSEEELGSLLWFTMGRPDANAYSPICTEILYMPRGYANPLKATTKSNYGKTAFASYRKLGQVVDLEYRKHIKIAQKKWRNFEKYAAKQLKRRTKELLYILKKDEDLGIKKMTNIIHAIEYDKWFLTLELIQELTGE